MEPDNNVNDGLPQELENLDKANGISIKDGLEFCGSSKALLKFLNTFFKSIDDKSQSIKEAFDKNDINTYSIKVHSLKSTARIIGAKELSELARKLEEAGDEGNIQFIKENTDKLLNLFATYKEKLSFLNQHFSENDSNKSPMPKEILEDAYNTLRELISSMDYDSVEMVIEGMRKYKMEEPDKKRIEALDENLKKLDWDKMEEIIRTI